MQWLTIPYRCKAITNSFHEFEEKHLQELLLTGTLGYIYINIELSPSCFPSRLKYAHHDRI